MQLSFGQAMNLSGVDPNAGVSSEPIPAGWHVGHAEEIDVITKNWGTGAKIKMRIREGIAANRVCFDNNLTIVHNTSAQANDIGQRKLRQWADAVGIDPSNITSLEPMLGKTVRFKVSVQDGREYIDKNGQKQMGSKSNRIDAFASADMETAAPAPAPAPARAPTTNQYPNAAQQAAVQAQAAPKMNMPWNKK